MSTSRAARCFISLSRSSVSVWISPNTYFLNLSNSSLRFSNASFHSLLGTEVGGAGAVVVTVDAEAATDGVSDCFDELRIGSFEAAGNGGG